MYELSRLMQVEVYTPASTGIVLISGCILNTP